MQNTSRAEDRSATIIKYSSSACAVAGGTILASNTDISKYGFILLAMSSGQMFVAGLMTKDRQITIYAASVFFFVDLLGIYRWIL